MLIGRAPHIAENAWLNRLYSPIDKIEILKLEDGINKKIPASYVDFLTDFSNGLNILGDTLCLFGYRSNYMRTVDFSWQPYSLYSQKSSVILEIAVITLIDHSTVVIQALKRRTETGFVFFKPAKPIAAIGKEVPNIVF